MKDFLDALGLKDVVLAAHFFGGAVVQHMALRYAPKLKALLLIGTGARLRVLPEAPEMMCKMAFGEIPPKFFIPGVCGKSFPGNHCRRREGVGQDRIPGPLYRFRVL